MGGIYIGSTKNLKNPENQRRERNILEEAHEHFVIKTVRHEETRWMGFQADSYTGGPF